AKAVDNSDLLTDKTLHTHAGQILGTLKYMSPEQATTSEKDVDTRADVYALGVMLYELLTGETPLDDDVIRQQSMLGALELIRDHEPVRPSVKLSDETRTESISSDCGTTFSALRQLLRGDLDWVVMKALENDRERRYDSASSLADDIHRFLNDEPVIARPPTAAYRLRKFARKNRILVSSGLAMLMLLISGIAATSWQAIRATQAERDANQQEQIAIAKAVESEQRRIEADELRGKGEEARSQAETEARRAERILNFVVESYNSADPMKGAKKDMLARDVLVHALGEVETKVGGDAETQAALYNALASSLYGLGDYDSALVAAQRATSLYAESRGMNDEKTVRANLLLAYVLLAQEDSSRALDYFNAILAIESGAMENEDPIPLETVLASSPLAIEALIGVSKSFLGPPYPEPVIAVNKARLALKAAQILLGESDTVTIDAKLTLAIALRRTGEAKDAVEVYREVLAARISSLGEANPLSIEVMLRLAAALESAEESTEAIEMTEKAARLSEQILGKEHPRTCEAECQLGDFLINGEQTDRAKGLFSSVNSRLAATHPIYHRSQRGLARALLAQGDSSAALDLYSGEHSATAWVYLAMNRPALAAKTYEDWIGEEKVQAKQLMILHRLVGALMWAGKLEEAEISLQRQERLFQQIEPFAVGVNDVSIRISKARLWAAKGEFEKAEAEAVKLLNPTVIAASNGLAGLPGNLAGPKMSHAMRNVDRAWCNSILALCRAERGGGSNKVKKDAVEALEQLEIRMALMPSHRRWTVIEACRRVIRVCELTKQTAEAELYRKRLPVLETERVRLTLQDTWQENLFYWKAGGLGNEVRY
ncbi:MAG: tetratricopeptide (TPR) repeat protein, partial [Pirellulaceae bacterium]